MPWVALAWTGPQGEDQGQPMAIYVSTWEQVLHPLSLQMRSQPWLTAGSVIPLGDSELEAPSAPSHTRCSFLPKCELTVCFKSLQFGMLKKSSQSIKIYGWLGKRFMNVQHKKQKKNKTKQKNLSLPYTSKISSLSPGVKPVVVS